MFSFKGAITNLGKYNEGELVFQWIEFPIDDDKLKIVFEKIGVGDEYDEYFFSDWDCNYDINVNLGEYETINRLNEIAKFYGDLDSRNDIDVFNAICESVEDFESAIDLYTSNQYIYYGRVNFSNLANDLATNRIKCLECSDDVKDFILANFNYRGYADTLLHYITKTEFGYVEILY